MHIIKQESAQVSEICLLVPRSFCKHPFDASLLILVFCHSSTHCRLAKHESQANVILSANEVCCVLSL